MEDLLNATRDNTPTFVPDLKSGKVIYIVDGDTFDVACVYDKRVVKFRIRLEGIDTPELRSKSEVEKKHAVDAKQALTDLIMGKIIFIGRVKWGPFGRLICTVYHSDVNICDYMVNNKFAVECKRRAPKEFDWNEYRGVEYTV